MIFIRVDANSQIGMGHMMRCLSVAEAFLKAGKDVAFICSKDTDTKAIEEKGFGYCVLGNSYKDMMSEVAAVTELLMSMGAELYIVDSYQVTRDYFFALKPFIKICVFEDIAGNKYAVDYLINYNLYADVKDYEDNYKNTKLLLGPSYAPLRKEFAATNYSVNKDAKKIMITTGGADMYNLSAMLVNELLKYEATNSMNISIVSGALNKNLDELKNIEKKNSNVKIYTNVKNMAEVMSEQDVVITGAGSTVCELLCLGIPFACVSFVDNQKLINDFCRNNDISIYAADYCEGGDKEISTLVAKVIDAISDYDKRKALSDKGKDYVDGKGALRIVKDLLVNA